jgi:hypothetical protein
MDEPPADDQPMEPPQAFGTQDGNTLMFPPSVLRYYSRYRRWPRRWVNWWRQNQGQWPRYWQGQGQGQGQWGRPWQGQWGRPWYGSGQWRNYQGRWPGRVYNAGYNTGYTGYNAYNRYRYNVPQAGVRSWVRQSPAVRQVRQMIRNAQRVGTLRNVRSGVRYPVFGGRVGRQNYRIITRQQGGMRHEVMAIRHGALEPERAI